MGEAASIMLAPYPTLEEVRSGGREGGEEAGEEGGRTGCEKPYEFFLLSL